MSELEFTVRSHGPQRVVLHIDADGPAVSVTVVLTNNQAVGLIHQLRLALGAERPTAGH